MVPVHVIIRVASNENAFMADVRVDVDDEI